MANPCASCPFNDGLTEEATQAQNYGCLPDRFQILDAQDKVGKVWMCHSNERRICRGLQQERQQLKKGPPVFYSRWYRGEQTLAVKITSVTIGPMPRPMPEGMFDAMPKVTATFENGETKELFEFFPDEISFTEQEFVGLTELQAHELRHRKDVRYLQS